MQELVLVDLELCHAAPRYPERLATREVRDRRRRCEIEVRAAHRKHAATTRWLDQETGVARPAHPRRLLGPEEEPLTSNRAQREPDRDAQIRVRVVCRERGILGDPGGACALEQSAGVRVAKGGPLQLGRDRLAPGRSLRLRCDK